MLFYASKYAESMKFFILLCATLSLVLFLDTNQRDLISRETLLTFHRDKFHIEPRVSNDGEFTLTSTSCSDTALPPASIWIQNHNRTLRMFLSETNNTHETHVVIQQAYKHRCFILHSVHALEKITHLHWSGPTMIAFESSTALPIPIGYTLDLRTLLYENNIISKSQTLSAYTGDID